MNDRHRLATNRWARKRQTADVESDIKGKKRMINIYKVWMKI